MPLFDILTAILWPSLALAFAYVMFNLLMQHRMRVADADHSMLSRKIENSYASAGDQNSVLGGEKQDVSIPWGIHRGKFNRCYPDLSGTRLWRTPPSFHESIPVDPFLPTHGGWDDAPAIGFDWIEHSNCSNTYQPSRYKSAIYDHGPYPSPAAFEPLLYENETEPSEHKSSF